MKTISRGATLYSKAHICYFTDTRLVGGAERYLSDLMNSMSRHGYRITLICHHCPEVLDFFKRQTSGSYEIMSCSFPSVTRSKAIQAGLAMNRSVKGLFNVLKIPGLLLYYWNTFRCFLRIAPLLRRASPDICHISAGGYPAGESFRAVVAAARLLKIPRRLLTVHSQALPPPISFPEKWIDRIIDHSLHAVIAASEDSRKSLIINRGFDAEKIHVIYCGIETSREEPAGDPQTLRRDLGIPANGRVVGAIGALEPGKGYSVLIEAFDLLTRSHADSLLAIIGAGSCEETLRQAIRERSLEKRVFLLGYRPQAQKYNLAFDVFVFSSNRFECVPYVIKDAMLAGVPIVSTDVGGTSEAIENERTGLLVPSDDPAALAKALDRLLQNKDLCRRLAEHAKKRVVTLFSLDKMTSDTEALYGDGARPC